MDWNVSVIGWAKLHIVSSIRLTTDILNSEYNSSITYQYTK